MARNYTKTQLEAKELGVPKWHVLGNEKLKSAIALKKIEQITAPTETVNVGEAKDEDVIEVTETITVPVVEAVEEETLTLPTDIEKKVMIWGIKCIGKKSPYWKYKDLLGM